MFTQVLHILHILHILHKLYTFFRNFRLYCETPKLPQNLKISKVLKFELRGILCIILAHLHIDKSLMSTNFPHVPQNLPQCFRTLPAHYTCLHKFTQVYTTVRKVRRLPQPGGTGPLRYFWKQNNFWPVFLCLFF